MIKSIIKSLGLLIGIIILQFIYVVVGSILMFAFYHGSIDSYLKSPLFETTFLVMGILFTGIFIFIFRQFVTKDKPVYSEKIFLLFTCGILFSMMTHVFRLLYGTLHHEAFSFLRLLETGILGPIAEEYLFRGKMYDILKQSFSNKYAMCITTVFFAFSHSASSNILYAFLLGGILMIVYEKTRSLKVASAFHIGANMMALLFVSFCI